MIAHLWPWLPLALPLLAALAGLLGGRRVPPVALAWICADLLLAAAVACLGFRAGFNVRSGSTTWLTTGTTAIEAQLDWSDGRDLIALLLLLLGALGSLSYGLRRGDDERSRPAVLIGIALVVAGGCIAVGTSGVVGVGGVGLAGLGMLGIELAGNPDHPRGGTLPVLTAGCLMLAVAALDDATLLATTPWWAVGCLILMLWGPLGIAGGSVAVWPRALIFALGVPSLGGWLLVRSVTATPEVWPSLAFPLFTLLGTGLIVGGAIVAVTATRLRGVLAGAWTLQWGLVVLALGQRGPALALLAHGIWTLALLGYALHVLAEACGSDVIAELRRADGVHRRAALVYGLAAGSALGLPLLAGYTLHAQLVDKLQGPLPAIVLGANVLMALAFVPPLAAFGRTRATAGTAGNPGTLPVLLGALLLIPGNGWDAIRLLLLDPGHANLPATIGAGIARMIAALLVVAVANGRLRRLAERQAQATDLGEPGWALPWGGLRRVMLPTPGPRWRNRFGRFRQQVPAFRQMVAQAGGAITERFYLTVVIAVVIGTLAVVAGWGGR